MDSAANAAVDLNSFIESINQSDIASIRTVANGLIRLLEDPRATMRQLTDVIEVDPPLTGKILTRSNSVSSFPNRTIVDIEQAVLWMGLNNLKELALQQKVCELFTGGREIHGYSRLKLWRHCVAVAHFAKTLVRREFGDPGGMAYSAGLLHDIGLIAIDQLLEEQFLAILDRMAAHKLDITPCEQDILGFTHGQAGQALALDWGLPEDMAACIGSHADAVPPDPYKNREAAVIYLADQLCQSRGLGYCENHSVDRQALDTCRQDLGVSHEALALIMDETVTLMAAMEEQGML